MAEQSDLTITRGDPSGSHPIGSLNKYWTETLNEAATVYSANNAMGPQLLIAAAGDNYVAYSAPLYLTNIPDGMDLSLAGMATAETLGCWQWYNPAISGYDADFATDGRVGSFGNGRWTNIGTPEQTWVDDALVPWNATEAVMLRKGVSLRMSLSVVDGGVDGVDQPTVDAAVAIINAGYARLPIDAAADSNRPMVAAYAGQPVAGGIGGTLGADPS